MSAPGTIRFVNMTPSPVQFYWINYDGDRQPSEFVPAWSDWCCGGTSQFDVFVATDAKLGGCVIRTLKSFGTNPIRTSFRSPWQKGYASHCTSFVRFDRTSEKRFRFDSLLPCLLTGGSSPGCSYRHSFLSL